MRAEGEGMTEDEMVVWHTDSMDLSLRKLQETVKGREAWRAAFHRVTEPDMTYLLNNSHIGKVPSGGTFCQKVPSVRSYL